MLSALLDVLPLHREFLVLHVFLVMRVSDEKAELCISSFAYFTAVYFRICFLMKTINAHLSQEFLII